MLIALLSALFLTASGMKLMKEKGILHRDLKVGADNANQKGV